MSTGSARTSRSGARAAPIHRHGHWWERGGNCVHWRRETFDGHRNFFDLAGFIGQVEAHEYQLREDLAIEHEAITFGGADAALAAGESLLEFVVSLIFVAQAAHEAAAPTADLERVEGGLLVFGRLHADGLEDLEEVLAAAVLAALFVIGGEACFVAGADGLHLDAGLVLGGEGVDEFAQVDAIFGHVVEHDAFAAEQRLRVDDLGGQADAFGVHARVHLEFVARLLKLGLLVHVFHGGDAQHAAIGEEGIVAAAAVVDVLEHLLARDALGATGVGAGAGEHLADLGTAMGADDDLGAAAGLGGAVVGELADELHRAEANDHGLGSLEGFVGLAVRLLLFLQVGFELWEGEDGHRCTSVRKDRRRR